MKEFVHGMWNCVKRRIIQLRLLIVRFIRLTKVMCTRGDIVLYSFLVLLWVIFALITNKVSFILDHNGETVGRTLWNLRNTMFSSIVLAFSIGAFNHIKDYRKLIKAQHFIYSDSMYSFEEIFRAMTKEIEWQEYSALYNEKCVKLSLEHIKDTKVDITSSEFIKAIDIIQSTLSEIDTYLKMGQLIVGDEVMLKLNISGAAREINNIILDEDYSRIKRLIWDLFNVVEQLRYPWRRDKKLDIIMIKLSKDSKNDFYKRMWLPDFNPWEQDI